MEIVGRHDNGSGAAVDIRGFHATAYKRINMWVRIDQIQDVQYPLLDVDVAHAADLEPSFHHQALD